MKETGNTGKESLAIMLRRYFPIFILFICVASISLWIMFGRQLDEDIPSYNQITADNGVVLHVLETNPSSISLITINDNVVQSGTNGINGGFFWENSLLSIAAMDGIPANGSPNEYGSGWFNAKYARGTIVYDRITGQLDVQRASSVDDLHITDSTKFWAQGGVSMNIKDDDNWYKLAVEEEALPFPDENRLRSGIAYDDSGEIYLIVSSTKCTAEAFRTAIKSSIAVGSLEEAIFLDGDGSSQLLIGDVKLKGDDRKVVQMIAVNEEMN